MSYAEYAAGGAQAADGSNEIGAHHHLDGAVTLRAGEALVEVQVEPIRFDVAQPVTYYVDFVVSTSRGGRFIVNAGVEYDRLTAHDVASRLARRYNVDVRHHPLSKG